MQAEPVFFGVDRDRAQAEFRGGAHDADRDFAAIERKKFRHLFRVLHGIVSEYPSFATARHRLREGSQRQPSCRTAQRDVDLLLAELVGGRIPGSL